MKQINLILLFFKKSLPRAGGVTLSFVFLAHDLFLTLLLDVLLDLSVLLVEALPALVGDGKLCAVRRVVARQHWAQKKTAKERGTWHSN